MIPGYERPLYRPPAEAGSLIIRAAYGCPNNSCSFCGMYKDAPYRERPFDEVETEMRAAAGEWPDARRIFLADGDVMHLPFEKLKALMETANRFFPDLARISLYANSISILRKTPEELAALKSLKLHTAYVGLESGSDAVLERLRKKDRSGDAIRAAKITREAGIRLSVMILIGAGGKAGSEEHVRESVKLVNAIQPSLLSLLTLIPVPGTPLFREIREGRFTPLDKEEVLLELRSIISGLDLKKTVFRANHTSNPLPLEGRLGRDKERLLAEVEGWLENRAFLDNQEWANPFFL